MSWRRASQTIYRGDYPRSVAEFETCEGLSLIEMKTKKNGAQGQSFESSLASLERIVRELERGELPLEKSLELFEEGVRLSRECQERLNEAERRIEVLLQDNDGRTFASALGGDGLARSSSSSFDGLDDEAGTDDDETVF
jgi:exodeoxyribonuclease VII small subunit